MARLLPVAFAFAFFINLPVMADARSVHDRKSYMHSLEEKPYARVRAALISAGYTPVRFRHSSNENECSGRQWCDIYRETDYCSGTGIALCRFVFYHRASRRYLAVMTYGENILTTQSLTFLTRFDMWHWDPHTH
jgi:hypothetical protein